MGDSAHVSINARRHMLHFRPNILFLKCQILISKVRMSGEAGPGMNACNGDYAYRSKHSLNSINNLPSV